MRFIFDYKYWFCISVVAILFIILFLSACYLMIRFERVWRGLKGRPDLFAQYISCFKKSTFKKVLKEAVSPDLLSFMWAALRDHAPSAQVQVRALQGFSASPSFSLTLSLLPEQDVRCIHSILHSLQRASAAAGPSDGEGEGENVVVVSEESVRELCKLYDANF